MQIQITRLKSYGGPGSLPVFLPPATPVPTLEFGLAVTYQINLELKL